MSVPSTVGHHSCSQFNWGNAPLGLDSDSLWASSLAVPAMAGHLLREHRGGFKSRDGKLMTLFVCSKNSDRTRTVTSHWDPRGTWPRVIEELEVS
jgi:hypothetical protein